MPVSSPTGAVFLSYAREDAAAARRIAEALRATGIEVWFDEDELRGGDSWDAKIRQQIKECALFMPIISARTEARSEGYFRREWKQAVERLEDIAEGVPFLVPLCIDDTTERSALVPRGFRHVQWTWLGRNETPDKFVLRVRQLLGRAEPASVGRSVGSALPTPATVRSARPNRWHIWVGIGVAIVIGAALWMWRQPAQLTPAIDATITAQQPSRGASTTAVTPAKPAEPHAKSIAVLAFVNLSGDKENEYFSDGVSDELANVLAKIPELKVSGRASAFHYKGKTTPLAEIGETLNVGYVVDGTVQRSGTRVKITANLNTARDGFRVWSETYTRELKDIFAVQEEIAAVIAQNLQLKLGATSRAKKTVNPAAHALVLEGRHHWNLRTTDAFARAHDAYTKALAIDPLFAEAMAGLADNWASRGWYKLLAGEALADDEFATAKKLIRRAQELDPAMAEPYATMGAVLYNERKFAESEEQFQKAIRLNPSYAWAHHWRAHLLITRGYPEASLESFERALALDPLSIISLVIYSTHLYEIGRYAEALDMVERALVLRPKGFVPLHSQRALCLSALGRHEEAVAEAAHVTADIASNPRWWSDAHVIYVLRLAGRQAEAERHAGRIMPTLSPQNNLRGFALAALNRHPEALPYLEHTISSGIARFFYQPMWDGVRDDPRLPAVLAKLNITEEYALARQTLDRLRRASAAKK